MKKLPQLVCLMLAAVLLGCLPSIREGRAWVNGKVGTASINVDGYWNSEQFGAGRLVQKENLVTGIIGDYYAEGSVNNNRLWMVLTTDRAWTEITVELSLADSVLDGRYARGMLTEQNGKKVSFNKVAREFKKSFETIDIDARQMWPGERWLFFNAGTTDVNINGKWYDEYWGEADIVQDGDEFHGIIGRYYLKGVICDKTVYMIMYTRWGLCYSAIMKADNAGIHGKYFQVLTYNDDIDRTPGWRIKLERY